MELLPVAELHELRLKILHGGIGAPVLAAGLGVGRALHIGQHGHLGNAQRVDDNVDVKVSTVVVAVRVGADQRLVAGELRFGKLHSQRLGAIHGEAGVLLVTGIKADDIVVALDVLPLLVFAKAEIGSHTRDGEVLLAAVEAGEAVVRPGHQPSLFIPDGLVGELVVGVEQVGFGGAVVGVLRGDMFERCQRHHLPGSAPDT